MEALGDQNQLCLGYTCQNSGENVNIFLSLIHFKSNKWLVTDIGWLEPFCAPVLP